MPARRLPRNSLRTNAVLMVLAMLVLPQLLVIGWSLMERDIGGTLQWSTREAAKETEAALESAQNEALGEDDVATRIDEIASKYNVRVRIVRADGSEPFDADHDSGTDFIHHIGTWFFGPDGAPTLRPCDETLGPVTRRPEIADVTSWSSDAPPMPPPLPEGSAHQYPIGTSRAQKPGGPPPVSTIFSSKPPPADRDYETGCRTSPAGKLLVCHAARGVTIGGVTSAIYVQESSRRAVRALYDLRYQLLRLSVITLPLALVFSWWMGRRMVRPIGWLRERVLEKAKSANPRADLVHEFKNPVAAIRTCAESLDSGAVDEKRAARLSRILSDSSTRLDALVSQFLELARAEAGMPNEVRAPIDLAALTRGVTHAIAEAHPEVTFEVDADEELLLTGVEQRLHSLVRNLVDNAASFAGTSGKVRVSVATDADEPTFVALEVSDSGPGIAEKDLPRMFERFFTTRAVESGASEPTARKQGKGTGLGLALVKAVAEAHGGRAFALSPPGRGATFRVLLPTL